MHSALTSVCMHVCMQMYSWALQFSCILFSCIIICVNRYAQWSPWGILALILALGRVKWLSARASHCCQDMLFLFRNTKYTYNYIFNTFLYHMHIYRILRNKHIMRISRNYLGKYFCLNYHGKNIESALWSPVFYSTYFMGDYAVHFKA